MYVVKIFRNIMGCRPSRSSLGRVADSTNEYNRCYLKEFDKARRKQKRTMAKNQKRKTPTYSQFSSTTRTYDHQSRMSRITVRLSTDGSMLEIEQCDLDLIREGKGDGISEYSRDGNTSDSIASINENGDYSNENSLGVDMIPQLRSESAPLPATTCTIEQSFNQNVSPDITCMPNSGNTVQSNIQSVHNKPVHDHTINRKSKDRDDTVSNDNKNGKVFTPRERELNGNEQTDKFVEVTNNNHTLSLSGHNCVLVSSNNRNDFNTCCIDGLHTCLFCGKDKNDNIYSTSSSEQVDSLSQLNTPTHTQTLNRLCNRAILVCLKHRGYVQAKTEGLNTDHCVHADCFCDNGTTPNQKHYINEENGNVDTETKMCCSFSACCTSCRDPLITPLHIAAKHSLHYQTCRISIHKTDCDCVGAVTGGIGKIITDIGHVSVSDGSIDRTVLKCTSHTTNISSIQSLKDSDPCCFATILTSELVSGRYA